MSALTFQSYVIFVDLYETVGVLIIMGPLLATVGGIAYAMFTDAFRGSKPQFRISFLSRRNAKDEAERDEARGRDNEVWSYINELRKRIR
jgi:hypothetical protein